MADAVTATMQDPGPSAFADDPQPQPPPPTIPGPVDPVLGVCSCGEPVTRASLAVAYLDGEVLCWACVSGGESGEGG